MSGYDIASLVISGAAIAISIDTIIFNWRHRK